MQRLLLGSGCCSHRSRGHVCLTYLSYHQEGDGRGSLWLFFPGLPREVAQGRAHGAPSTGISWDTEIMFSPPWDWWGKPGLVPLQPPNCIPACLPAPQQLSSWEGWAQARCDPPLLVSGTSRDVPSCLVQLKQQQPRVLSDRRATLHVNRRSAAL